MKTKKVLETIDVMTESVVKELNDMSEKIDGKANHSYVQTIAKHLMNLEQKVTDLEKEKCKCKEYHTPLSVIEFILNPPYEHEYKDDHPDYFLKAKNLLIEYAETTMIKKGIEYTPVGDRFANFRPILGEKKTAIEKLIGYNAKHVQYCYMQESNMTAKTIDELLEHWGDVFNYNVLGLAMQNTDRSKAFVVPYADRNVQEKEIKRIVDTYKSTTVFAKDHHVETQFKRLLTTIDGYNLYACIILFAKQLERLENSK